RPPTNVLTGESNEIDVHKIGLQERTYLLQRLVKDNTNDVNNDQSVGD
ncbi:pleiotropic drug resistance protein, partial [Trifolium medium]|nr:pleiotropic drug resistance protein [Trifolium medium]